MQAQRCVRLRYVLSGLRGMISTVRVGILAPDNDIEVYRAGDLGFDLLAVLLWSELASQPFTRVHLEPGSRYPLTVGIVAFLGRYGVIYRVVRYLKALIN